MRDLPSLDLLKGFEAAGRHLSFTKAGAELFLTQAAISRQVQALEAQLGVQLFQRRIRAQLLTDEGVVSHWSVATKSPIPGPDASPQGLDSTAKNRRA